MRGHLASSDTRLNVSRRGPNALSVTAETVFGGSPRPQIVDKVLRVSGDFLRVRKDLVSAARDRGLIVHSQISLSHHRHAKVHALARSRGVRARQVVVLHL